jgi:hypothetical protein
MLSWLSGWGGKVKESSIERNRLFNFNSQNDTVCFQKFEKKIERNKINQTITNFILVDICNLAYKSYSCQLTI